MNYRIRVKVFNDNSKQYLPEVYTNWFTRWCSLSYKRVGLHSFNEWLHDLDETRVIIDRHWDSVVKSTEVIKIKK